MRRLRSGCRRACEFAVIAAAIVAAACAPSGPATRPAGAPTPLPPAARPEPAPAPPPPASSAPAQPAAATRPPAGVTCRAAEELFQGQYRSGAKTEYARRNGTLAEVESFADLDALKSFLRPQIDQVMRHHYPHLSAAGTAAAGRVAEERHNVVVDAYLYAVKHESGPHGDHDFHIMLGSSPTPGAGLFMTAEASALPPGGADRPLLAAARRQLLSVVGACDVGDRFMAISPPMRVRVSGSLFFDGAHGIGSVGPAYAKPFTVWEIHPVLAIERLDGGAGASAAASPAAAHDPGTAASEEPASSTPASPPPAPGGARAPTARCRDGSLSYAKSHSGACSGHGGVAEWLQ